MCVCVVLCVLCVVCCVCVDVCVCVFVCFHVSVSLMSQSRRYIEAVRPGQFGIAQSPLFFLSLRYWCGSRVEKVSDGE